MGACPVWLCVHSHRVGTLPGSLSTQVFQCVIPLTVLPCPMDVGGGAPGLGVRVVGVY